ncbi:MAG TPA: FAD-binding protein, partial [Firmicutes bacterium]|nr:FAD-binding protein [Bacillota bacterium]
MQIERMLSPMGPLNGNLKKKFHKNAKFAFIQCVGSRNKENPYCSSACCMYALKEAGLIKENLPQAEIFIFFMDVRTFGKGYYKYGEDVKKKKGVHFINTRISNLEELPENKLLIKYEDENGLLVKEEFDAVILSTGQNIKVPEAFKKITDSYGFIKTDKLDITAAEEPGIYAVGSVVSPVDIPDTIIQATAAVSKVIQINKKDRDKFDFLQIYDEKLGVIVSNGTKTLPPAVIDDLTRSKRIDLFKVRNYFYLPDNFPEFIKLVKEHSLNRLLLIVEDPNLNKEFFREKIKRELKNYNVHVEIMKYSEIAEEKIIKQLLNFYIEKLRNESVFVHRSDTFKNFKVLVIGGGLAGIVIAKELSEAGVKVDIIEKEGSIGGNVKRVRTTIDNYDVSAWIKELIPKLESSNKVKIFTSACVTSISGCLGRYGVRIKKQEEEVYQEYSMLVIATGAVENSDNHFGYGANKLVLSQLDLSDLVRKKDFLNDKKTIAMIQCVNSRTDSNPYCSRVCCSAAIKNALKIKEKSPETEVYILYR